MPDPEPQTFTAEPVEVAGIFSGGFLSGVSEAVGDVTHALDPGVFNAAASALTDIQSNSLLDLFQATTTLHDAAAGAAIDIINASPNQAVLEVQPDTTDDAVRMQQQVETMQQIETMLHMQHQMEMDAANSLHADAGSDHGDVAVVTDTHDTAVTEAAPETSHDVSADA